MAKEVILAKSVVLDMSSGGPFPSVMRFPFDVELIGISIGCASGTTGVGCVRLNGDTSMALFSFINDTQNPTFSFINGLKIGLKANTDFISLTVESGTGSASTVLSATIRLVS